LSRTSSFTRWLWLAPVAAAVAVFHFTPTSGTLDRAFFDAASRSPLVAPTLPDNAALLLIDEASLATLGREQYAMRWPPCSPMRLLTSPNAML